MPRLSIFDSPFLLGFDHFERILDRVAKSSAEGYPPYNVEQLGENRIRISFAVAGFAAADLSVTVEDNQLIVRGRSEGDEGGRVFLHRGIAARQFQRAFVLAEGIEVKSARMESGLLHVELERRPPSSKVRAIKIEATEG